MICQRCGKRQATTHIKNTVNGHTTELHVCGECASAQGLSIFSSGGTQIPIGNLFGGLFATPSIQENGTVDRCQICGKTFREIVQSGRPGCAQCYVTFYDRLLPSIQRIHGKTAHIGKVAVCGSRRAHLSKELEMLKTELGQAIAAQEYERCAQLRDQIRGLEGTIDEE